MARTIPSRARAVHARRRLQRWPPHRPAAATQPAGHRGGAPLARLEAEIAFTTLLAGCPDLALAVDPPALVWRRSRVLRALKRLPVTFTPRASSR